MYEMYYINNLSYLLFPAALMLIALPHTTIATTFTQVLGSMKYNITHLLAEIKKIFLRQTDLEQISAHFVTLMWRALTTAE